jgi:nucleoside-diphosphate-sugar epimerase
MARVFNLVGPQEPTTLVCAAFAQRLAATQPGKQDLEIRNSESVRDFVDVRDVADALARLTDAPEGVYNIATGAPRVIVDIARMLVDIAAADVRLRPDGRGGDSFSVGSADRLRDATGWTPRYTLEQSLQSVWDDRLRLSGGSASASGAGRHA